MPASDSRRLVGLVLGLTLLIPVLLAAFTWPATDLQPRSLPVVAAGPDEVADQVGGRLAELAGADAFDVTAVADRDAAVDALEERDAYAAVLMSPDGGSPEVLVATAASPTVAQLFTQVAGEMDAQVTDVVPPPADDPRGAAFGSGALPLVLGGLILGAITSLVLPSARQRIAAVVGVTVLGGFAMVGVSQGWLGILDGSYLANSGVVMLGIAAMSLTVIGLRNLMGPAGIGIGALTFMVIGNPLSGITSAPEMLPLGWLGQLLPPGALGSALRSTAYFDGAAVWQPVLVLSAWALAGLALALAPGRRPEAVQSAEPVEAVAA
jgi:hypothetical protein